MASTLDGAKWSASFLKERFPLAVDSLDIFRKEQSWILRRLHKRADKQDFFWVGVGSQWQSARPLREMFFFRDRNETL